MAAAQCGEARTRSQRAESPPRWGLLADDLTGACDAGVQFAARGFASILLVGRPAAGPVEPELVIRSSHSRSDPPQAAAERVLELGEAFRQGNRTLIYKKIDSTLQGNLGTEIQAAMKICGTSLAVVAPAFPAMGRAMEDGWLMGLGGALVPKIHLPSLLREQEAANVEQVGRDVLEGGLAALIERLGGSAREAARLVVCDTLVPDHLRLIAEASLRLKERPLLVGSAGLSRELAALLARQYGRDRAPLKIAGPAGEARSVVMFIGSNNPVTLAQVEYLLSGRPATRVALREGCGGPVQSAIEARRHLVVMVDRNEPKERVADFASQVLKPECAGLFFAGGDTAQLICGAIGVEGIRLENEIALGLPWGRILGGPADGLPVATKAGGFGGERALAGIADFLARQMRMSRE